MHGVDEIDYQIDFVGSMRSRYTVDTIEQLALEDLGRQWHLQWSKNNPAKQAQEEQKYNNYEYYRRSSIAGAIHLHAREELGFVPSATVSEEMLATLEHKRWNAYMRSEGYVGCNHCKCDHLAKMHARLVPMEQVPVEDYGKDLISMHVKSAKSTDKKGDCQ